MFLCLAVTRVLGLKLKCSLYLRKVIDTTLIISILNSMAKLFDMVLCDRLNHWFRPLRKQAGAQRCRGCLEHIATLRLLIDTARRKKEKLCVMFVDFLKAYDLMPRNKLFVELKRLGCGLVMLGALTAMYRVTQSVVGLA